MRPSFNICSSAYDHSTAIGALYLRLWPEESGIMFGEPVDTIVEDVVFNIAILPFIALEVSRQTGMAPPDPLVIELV